MKRLFFTLMVLLPLSVMAQVRIGYLSYDTVMHQMPEYTQAQQSLIKLKAQYDQEATRGEEEFQRKFAEFLQGQKDFPQNILVKRQAELQALMENGVHFRQEAQQLLSKAEQDLLAEVSAKLDEVIRVVGLNNGYACILNTDSNQVPFINPSMGDDVTELVLRKMGLRPEPAPTAAPETEGETSAVTTEEATAATTEETQSENAE